MNLINLARRTWILVQWKCSLLLTRRGGTDFHRGFHRNAASGHISIPMRTHTYVCVFLSGTTESLSS
jgi:hypothetical protein